MKCFEGKRLLLLGGSKPYVKVAKAAKRLGADVIVVDQHATEEILLLSDDYLQLSLTDIPGIEEWCDSHPVDGILNFCVDFAQRTHFYLCEKYGLPCSYSKRQIDVLANKNAFKMMLQECGLDTIKSYDEQAVLEDRARYPLVIKPSEGSGSRGSMTCFNKAEALEGIRIAKAQSRSSDIIIEEFIHDAQEVQITFFLKNGKTYVIRTADSYQGKQEDQLDRVVACAISPSRFTSEFFSNTYPSVLKFVESLGLHDGPFFMQGFYHEGRFKFFDPGCRFPGVDFDFVLNIEFGVDIAELMVHLALSGIMPDVDIPENMYGLNGKYASVLFPILKAGVIKCFEGFDIMERIPKVFSVSKRHREGDEIEYSHDVNQRVGEIDILADSFDDLMDQINSVQQRLHVLDIDGKEMIYSHFDVRRIKR